jgi:HrpA-like RNA helicase
VDEINELCEKFRNTLDPKQFVICPLHGRLEPAEQKKAFEQVGSKFKLVFSSRIAETAITIDKVKVVIDVGYDREMVYDQTKRISSFELMQISQSAAKQRAGRAGRTTAGYCFRLYEEFEQKKMRTNKRPEIEGTPLDIVVLRLKQLQIHNIQGFPYLSPPPAENLKQSLETMQLIGCLDEKEHINEIGRTLVTDSDRAPAL